MIEETLHAANWWVEKIISYNINVEAPSWQSHFEKVMTELLRAKYHNHWYKDDPSRGSGYRAISNEYSLDPILDKAAKAVSHSLPKNLARMVLTSDDRWLVMFVNPGEVLVRDKKFQEFAIYDKQNHIYNKSLLKKKLATHGKWNKMKQCLYSKSDDETLGSLDETKSETEAHVETKSDPEDSENIDYRQLFLQNIHNAARRNKEKEIEAHVQAFKEEMRLNHYRYKGFGPYDEDDKYWTKSPSKSTTASSQSNITPTKSSPSKSSTADTPHNTSNKEKNTKSVSNTPQPSPPTTNTETNKSNHQILNVLNTLNLPKLHNGFMNHHHIKNNTFHIDTNDSNYGKHLKSILNSCRIHARSTHKPTDKKSSLTNGKKPHKNGIKSHEEYMQHPILFPMSYASPSPSISPHISPFMTPIDTLNEEITPLSNAQSKGFELHMHESSDEATIHQAEDDDVVKSQSEQSEIIVNNTACSPIYGNSKLRIATDIPNP
eukprot:312755_1